MATIVRILFGFVFACLAAALTQVLFVITPADLYALDGDARVEQAGRALAVALSAATQFFIFAAPFALVAVVFGAVQGLRGWAYYVFVGLAIALFGFATLYVGEDGSDFTIANSYALAAFAFSGVIAGYVYWILAGRAGGDPMPKTAYLKVSDEDATRARAHLKASDYERAKGVEAPRETTPAPMSGVPDAGLRKSH